MLTMVIGGLWHGANWTFVAWGALHGAGLAFERARLWHRSRNLLAQAAAGTRWPRQATPDGVRPQHGDTAAPAGVPGHGAGRPGGTGRPGVDDRIGAWAITFNFVCLGWIFFRASSFANAVQVFSRSSPCGPHVAPQPHGRPDRRSALAVQWIPARRSAVFQQAFERWSLPAQALALAGVLVVIDAFGPAGVAPFIYFRF